MAMMENLDESQNAVVGWFSRARRFVTEARAELGRVTWPTRREVWATTIVVILVSTMFGLYLYAVDLTLNVMLDSLLRRFGGG
jgi:preprotein translocase subunit SecE